MDPKKELKNAGTYIISQSSDKTNDTSFKPKLRLENNVATNGDRKSTFSLGKLSLDLATTENTSAISHKSRAAHPMSCPPMYLLKQKRKWPVTPMPAALEKGNYKKTELAGVRAPPIESRPEDLNFLGLSIPSWRQGASGAVTLRGSGRCFGRERRSNREKKDRDRLARSVLLETIDSWEMYADVSTKSTFYRNAQNGTVQDIPPKGVAFSGRSHVNVDGFLASRNLASTIREEEEDEEEGIEAIPLTSSSSSSSEEEEEGGTTEAIPLTSSDDEDEEEEVEAEENINTREKDNAVPLST